MKYSLTLLVAAMFVSLALVAQAAPAPIPAPVPVPCGDDNGEGDNGNAAPATEGNGNAAPEGDNNAEGANGAAPAAGGGAAAPEGDAAPAEGANGAAPAAEGGAAAPEGGAAPADNAGGANGADGANEADNEGGDNGADGANDADNAGNAQGGGGAGGGGTANQGLAEGADTLLQIQGGIPGNDCVTFRNNGEMVQAACETAAADRKLKPVKVNGVDALEVQRTFVTPGFEIKEGQICLMNNGEKFRAEECSKGGTGNFSFVTFDGDNLVDANTCITNDDIGNNADLRTTARGANDENCAVMGPGPAPTA